MAGSPKQEYGNESITSLKGADRVRLRPGVIFGSDGLEGCAHSFFEILANAIDEARRNKDDEEAMDEAIALNMMSDNKTRNRGDKR